MKDLTQEKLLLAALQHIPFEGWTQRSFACAEREHALKTGTYAAYFPDGVQDFIRATHAWVDRQMLLKLASQKDFAKAKVREKIFLCVMARLDILTPHREAIRRLVGHQLLPWNKINGMRDVGRAADAMWKAAGDASADYNYYTKRILLSGVYATTLQFWFQDMSDDYIDTQHYLRARIDNVLKLGKFVGGIKERFAKKKAA